MSFAVQKEVFENLPDRHIWAVPDNTPRPKIVLLSSENRSFLNIYKAGIFPIARFGGEHLIFGNTYTKLNQLQEYAEDYSSKNGLDARKFNDDIAETLGQGFPNLGKLALMDYQMVIPTKQKEDGNDIALLMALRGNSQDVAPRLYTMNILQSVVQGVTFKLDF